MTAQIKIKQCIQRLAFLTLAFLFACSEPNTEQQLHEISIAGRTMGTTYHIKWIAAMNNEEVKAMQKRIDEALLQVNQQMSTYMPDSELSRFNQNTSLKPIEISAGLAKVVAESIRLGQLSDGLLDVTVGPLVNLWGFGPTHRPDKVPTADELQQARQRVGIEHLSLIGNKLSKDIPNLYVDLSTIAKGYGVDQVAELLEQHNIHHYLVEIGGEMRVKGKKLADKPWRVAIEKPVTNERSVQQIITPFDHAVATSGDYRNYFEENGQRFSHIINPKTGKPINHKLVSVTVIDESCMTADGLSTMLMVMGTEKALAFANKHDLAILTITKTQDGFKQQTSVKFNQFLVQ